MTTEARRSEKTSDSVDRVGLCASGRHGTFAWVYSGQRRSWSEQYILHLDSTASSQGQAGATLERS